MKLKTNVNKHGELKEKSVQEKKVFSSSLGLKEKSFKNEMEIFVSSSNVLLKSADLVTVCGIIVKGRLNPLSG